MTATDSLKPRLLFCSRHCYVDPASGAALATRDLLQLMAGDGWPCAAVCGSQLDFEVRPQMEAVLARQGLTYQVQRQQTVPIPSTLFHFFHGGVPVTVCDAPGLSRPGPPDPLAAELLVALFEGVVRRFRPDVLLTYGGDELARRLIARGKALGLAVAFALHNFAYRDADFFRSVDGVLVPSEHVRKHYRRTLGLFATAIPPVGDPEQVRCPRVEGKYVTFVNPQPAKGVFWVARLVHELGRQRPDIPVLVVEGRGRIDWLGQSGLDLSELTSLNRMPNTADPRHFLSVSKVLLMPSLWQESFGRVAAEAMLNGIPVLASRRGALPETLGQSGFLFDVPADYTPRSRQAPSAEEVRPWLDVLLHLWDNEDFYAQQRQLCLEAALRWSREQLLGRYQAFFQQVCQRKPAPPSAGPERT